MFLDKLSVMCVVLGQKLPIDSSVNYGSFERRKDSELTKHNLKLPVQTLNFRIELHGLGLVRWTGRQLRFEQVDEVHMMD